MNHTKLLLNTKEIYEGLVKSYNLDKDLFSSYGKAYSLNRDREGKDKDEDPPAGSNQGLKKWKTSKDTERQMGSKSKDSQSNYPKAPSHCQNHLARMGAIRCAQLSHMTTHLTSRSHKTSDMPSRQSESQQSISDERELHSEQRHGINSVVVHLSS
ncbi:hypothetical protein Tco_0337714 [Tanacetum coccineum]